MSQQLILSFEILSDWHVGTGSEAGGYADALALKDSQGLPYLSGKAIKGLVKDAYQTAIDNQWFADHSALLFGTEGTSIEAQGLVQVTSAQLSAAEQAFFAEKPAAKKLLFKVQQFTAIDHQSGVALNSSLRSMEVARPVNLHALFDLNANHPNYSAAQANELLTQLAQVAPLIHVLGAKRHRGFGQVKVSAQWVARAKPQRMSHSKQGGAH